MCHYIAATLPAGTDLETLRPVLDERALAFTPLSNESFRKQLRPGTLYLRATRGHCDCGTVLGCLSEPEGPGARDRELRRLERKGWGPAKLERWLAEKQCAEAKRTREIGQERLTRTEEADRWIASLRAILATGLTGSLGLLLHWYGGNLEDEKIGLAGTETVRISDLEPEYLMRMKEDVLYQFTADGG